MVAAADEDCWKTPPGVDVKLGVTELLVEELVEEVPVEEVLVAEVVLTNAI